MCKPEKPDPVEVEAPDFLRSPLLDGARNPLSVARALRSGRNSLRIPRGSRPTPDPASTSGAQRSQPLTIGARGNGGPRSAGGGPPLAPGTGLMINAP